MKTDDLVVQRKEEHLSIIASGRGKHIGITTGFEKVRFVHCALPECDLGEIDLSTQFLGKRLNAPLLISSMTGGPDRATTINLHLAEAAELMGIAFAVGSQRVSIEGNAFGGLDRKLRVAAPTIPIYANFGAAQIGQGYGKDEVRRAIDMFNADALIIHLNPLQEAVQQGGDKFWTSLLSGIEKIVRLAPVPIIVKEVGFGISANIARQLEGIGVAAVDIAGAGGTNWALVEGERAGNEKDRAIATAFADWGIPTAQAIIDARKACPNLSLIGSGGVRNGVDVAKAIRLGADLVGQAAGLLDAAVISTVAVCETLQIIITQLRICCFCTGSKDLSSLRQALMFADGPLLQL